MKVLLEELAEFGPKGFWSIDVEPGSKIGRTLKAAREIMQHPSFGSFDSFRVPPHRDHITALYMGSMVTVGDQVTDFKVGVNVLPEVVFDEGVEALVSDPRMLQLFDGASVSGLGFFPATQNSGWEQPIVLHIESHVIETINDVLTRTLVPYMVQKQFSMFRPHATVGYTKNQISANDMRRAKEAFDAIPYDQGGLDEGLTLRFEAGTFSRIVSVRSLMAAARGGILKRP